jgi:hypothetical protein
MQTPIHDRLDAQFAKYSIEGQLHDVPPHEVYEVTVDGRRAVYKADTGDTGSAGIEGRVTAVVDRETTVPVPEILHFGEEFYVAAWHPDAPAPDELQAPDSAWARAAGRGLATLHAETADSFDGYGQFRPDGEGVVTTGHEQFQDAALEYVRHYRPTLARYGHGDIADSVSDFFRANPNAFAGVGAPVCCHGWATPEHVAVVDGEVACMVDFEHAMAAPPEFDLWRTAGPAFEDKAEVEAFRESYESVRLLAPGAEDRRPLWRLLNGVYFFVSLYVQDQHDLDATEQTAERLREMVTATLDEFG